MFGALGGVLPIRLGGSETEGVTAAQHARLAADWYALRQTAALCRIAWTVSGGVATVASYFGVNGIGLAHAPDLVAVDTIPSHGVRFGFSACAFADPYGVMQSFKFRQARAFAKASAFRESTVQFQISGTVSVQQFNAAGTNVAIDDGYVVVW